MLYKVLVSPSPLDRAATDALSRRKRRAVGLGALALVLVAAAGFAFLRSGAGIRTGAPAATPSTNPLLVSLIPINYDFVTASLGWAVENTFTPARSAGQFRVFRTVDGAKHWQLQLTGPSSSPGLMPITIQFFDTHGFMTLSMAFTGEQVYRTNDGGETWQAVRLPVSQTVVTTFSDTTYGWALAQANSSSGQLFNLYVTNDGGASWQRLPDPPREAFYLAFRGPTEAWMGSLGSGPPHIYTSADAGRTWHRHDLPPPPGRIWDTGGGGGATVQTLPGFGAVATVESGGLSVPGFGANGTDNADFFTSFDSGITWMYVAPTPGPVGHQDALHWWAIRGTTLSKSLDAGQTWTRITSTLPDWQFVPHILDANHAWAELTVADGFGLALTSDGGLHWIRANVPQQ
jgi:photosystem II stability/assembly factor-like uncharacterized protein